MFVCNGKDRAARIITLSQNLTGDVLQLMELGVPYTRARTSSNYWLYTWLFSSTCPTALVAVVRTRARQWGCQRIYLTSEPDNTIAYAAWTSLGFINAVGDYTVNGVAITRDFKGPGKDRAVFELLLP